jgi:hypothetical protein
MARCYVSTLTDSESRLLPLLATRLSLVEIAELLERPRDEVLANAVSIYAKLEVQPPDLHPL